MLFADKNKLFSKSPEKMKFLSGKSIKGLYTFYFIIYENSIFLSSFF